MRDIHSRVVQNKKVSDTYCLLTVEAESLPPICPGQFVQILCRDRTETNPFLRRPFSVMDVRGRRLDILYKVIGGGTRRMSEWRPGDLVSFFGPCGNPFSINGGPFRSALVLAGGTGLGGVYYLIRRLQQKNIRGTFLYGVKRQRDVARGLIRRLKMETSVVVEEKSGLVTDRLRRLPLDRYDRCFVCGPTGMMRAAAERVRGRIPVVEVSLEEMMGCGYGICYTCPVKKREGDGYYRACDEGPVFREETITL